MANKNLFLCGFFDYLPALFSLFPVGVILGMTAVDIGLTDIQSISMALGIYTGLAQAAMLELIMIDATAMIIIIAGIILNLRLMIYSASIAPYFDRLSYLQRFLYAYLLVDVVYALSYEKFQSESTDDNPAYYLGAAVGAWSSWQAGTLVGIYFGKVVPTGLDLQFAIPLVFIALLVPLLDEQPALLAGVMAGMVAVVGVGLPLDLGLITGTAAGTITGVLVERWWSV